MFLIDIDNIVLIFLRWEEILYLGSYKSWCRFGGWGLKVVIKSLLPSYKKQFSKKDDEATDRNMIRWWYW